MSNKASNTLENKASHPSVALQNAIQALNNHQYEQTIEFSSIVLKAAPNTPFAVLLLGIAQHHLGQPQGLQTVAYATSLAPKEATFHYNYAIMLANCNHIDLAMVEYRACLDLDPNFCDALWNYSNLLSSQELYTPALACCEKLLEIEGTMRQGMAHNMAYSCYNLGLIERADDLFQLALSGPEQHNANTHTTYALFLLEQGRFAEAWPHYAYRFNRIMAPIKSNFTFPIWQGEFKKGLTLFVQGDQGAGDQILFSSFFRELFANAKKHNVRIILACFSPLIRLFQANFPEVTIVADAINYPCDLNLLIQPGEVVEQIATGDLPLWIKKPNVCAYLQPNPDDVIWAKNVMPKLPGRVRKIGLIWSGRAEITGTGHDKRNVPPRLLNNWLLHVDNVQFFSLQTTEHRAALAYLADIPVIDMGNYLNDFSKTAALMCEMDLIVTVCTSTANLAGALGLDTHVLLKKNSDWRWFKDTSWFPHICTYKQIYADDWSAPLQQLAQKLSLK